MLSAGRCCGLLSPKWGLGWWIVDRALTSSVACGWRVLSKYASCKGGSVQTDTSWQLRKWETPEAGNRAGKTVQCVQWKASAPECSGQDHLTPIRLQHSQPIFIDFPDLLRIGRSRRFLCVEYLLDEKHQLKNHEISRIFNGRKSGETSQQNQYRHATESQNIVRKIYMRHFFAWPLIG